MAAFQPKKAGSMVGLDSLGRRVPENKAGTREARSSSVNNRWGLSGEALTVIIPGTVLKVLRMMRLR